MKHPIVVGMQYGDEGKGKITDTLAKQATWVIRFNGGNNAGHTLWLNGKKLVTHSVPSGIRYSHCKNFIGAGCVVDPIALKKEMTELAEAGVDFTQEGFKIDGRAHVILPIHLALDASKESGPQVIGTTKRGIGPAYTTKTDRTGIRVEDVLNGSAPEKLKHILRTYNSILREYGAKESTEKENLEVLEAAHETFKKYVSHETTPFYDVAKTDKCVLEGAQGILLDLDHGSYPYVTSSTILPAFAAAGTPFPSSKLGPVIGVAKAYVTRVGAGPFPTELDNEIGERIRKNGAEFGATTGRPRRTGWLNLDELRDAVRLSDCTGIVLTKADILKGEPTVELYSNKSFQTLGGWDEMTIEGGEKLHPNLEKYVTEIEKFCGCPVIALGTGPDREEMFWRHKNFQFWPE